MKAEVPFADQGRGVTIAFPQDLGQEHFAEREASRLCVRACACVCMCVCVLFGRQYDQTADITALRLLALTD